MRALYGAGLLESAYQGEALTVPVADSSAEDLAFGENVRSWLLAVSEEVGDVSEVVFSE